MNDRVKARVRRDAFMLDCDVERRKVPVENYRAAKRSDRQRARLDAELSADAEREMTDCEFGFCAHCDGLMQ